MPRPSENGWDDDVGEHGETVGLTVRGVLAKVTQRKTMHSHIH